MAERNTNLAYDLSRYEDRAERAMIHSSNRIKSHTSAKPKKIIATPLALLLIIVAGCMVTSCLTMKGRIAAVHAEIVTAEANVHALEQENVSMLTRLEQKSSQKVVEDYAENVLGMQKLDNAQVEYISLESGNKVEITENEKGFFKKAKTAFDDFMEYLRG